MVASGRCLEQSSEIISFHSSESFSDSQDSIAFRLWEKWGILAAKISLIAITTLASVAVACTIGYFAFPLFAHGSLGWFGGVTAITGAAGLVFGITCAALTEEGKAMFQKTGSNLADCGKYLLSAASWSATALAISMAIPGLLGLFAITATEIRKSYGNILCYRALYVATLRR